MKIKLINPPSIKNKVRGAGFYGENLINQLKKTPGIEIVDSGEDLVHYLYFDLFFLTLPIFRNTKTVVTVFDLTPIVLNNLYPRGLKGEIKWQIQKRLLQSVDAVITISNASKIDLIKILCLPEQKIHVTYLAPGKDCKDLNLKKDNSVVYIGDVDKNKNILSLLKAMSLLKDEKLFLVGKSFLDHELPEAIEVRSEIQKLKINERVFMTGFISEEEKVILLNKAKVYVQPSLYEGFGLPVLESMACGTPVICGNNSSLPEIAGSVANYVDVTDPKDIASKIRAIIPNKKKCLEQAARFSWSKTAQETTKIYEKVISG